MPATPPGPNDGRGRVIRAPRVDRRPARRQGRSWRKRIGPAPDRDVCRRRGWPVRRMARLDRRAMLGRMRAPRRRWARAAILADPRRPRRRPRSRPRPSSRPARRATTATPRSPPRSPPSPPPIRRSSRASRSARATRAATSGRSRSPTTSTTDEAEPEVMFDGTHHADEHMATEMTLHILHWLVDGYGVGPADHPIVDTREIWIVFVVNPDGAEYDISGGHFHFWRKNRQPTPGLDARSAPTSTATTAITGAAAVGPARTRQAITYRGPARVLHARGPCDARLHGQPRRRRPSADPGGHHVPRVRPAGHVAVRLHDGQRPRRT